ncbi:hypothetical protein PRZ48_009950 [Zasmidium cellare]|uniref:FAS1 domain-containing protein n=1 Tax=Zasmidium cellare TaxID=395010 RepID=A0ABR0EDS7_ZASCE|nr:hypothetical protein PRZ48_009950 [Zasmidium cellare]
MRPSTLLTSTLALTTQAQLLPFLSQPSQTPALAQPANQNPMANPGIQLPPPSEPSDPPPTNGDVILSDILGTQRPITIFAGFTRDISSVLTRLSTASLNTTVLAPLNSAITSLPRKPWEDPRDGPNAYEGQDGEDRAQRNLRRFTEAHVVLASPWEEGVKSETMGGGRVWWERRGEKVVVMPGSVEVERVGGRVANGEVWVMKGVVNYAS